MKNSHAMNPQEWNQLPRREPLAHVSEREVQELSLHLSGVSTGTGERSAKLGLRLVGELIGLMHDLGKYSLPFREYIESFLPGSTNPRHDLRGKIDHSTAGAQVLFRHLSGGKRQGREAELARVLALCVVSHHSGLIDCINCDGQDGLSKRLSRPESSTHADEAYHAMSKAVLDKLHRLLDDPQLLTELSQKVNAVLHDGLADKQPPSDRNHMQLGLLIRLLFSCLIDADRTDTADADKPLSAEHRQHQQYTPWSELFNRLDMAIGVLPATGTLSKIRRDVSTACFIAAARPVGCYTLTVPTGGGKTLAALRFALKHAETHKLDRVIFVSPFISIVDQNAAVARRALEPEGVPYATVVLEHHSNLIEDAPKNTNGQTQQSGPGKRDHWRRKILTENWDAPVVFTTMTQVLEAMFGSGTRSVRRLHALAHSVIVFDEAQTLPMKLIHLYNNAVNLLTRHCGSTSLLCTATQPILHRVDSERGALRLAEKPELVDGQLELFAQLKRYTVRDLTNRPGGWTHAEIAALAKEEATSYGSCLVVVNTKRDARTIFELCREQMPDARLAHLSTSMCPTHRTAVLTELKEWLNEEPEAQRHSPVVCVSTQLIEAGVDIDFGAVIRDLAGLDSVAQAAGRCNRNGKRPSGSVTIVLLPKLPKGLEDIKLQRKAAQRVLDDWRRSNPGELFPLHETKPMRDYFEQIFHDLRDEMTYRTSGEKTGQENNLLSLLGTNAASVHNAKNNGIAIERHLLRQSFAAAADAFELIAPTQGVLVPFGKAGAELVNEIVAARDLTEEWQLLRKAQQYTVSVYSTQFQALERAGATYRPSSAPDLCIARSEFYDSQFGLHNNADPMEAQIA